MRDRFLRNPGRIVELNVGDTKDVLDLRWKDELAHVICVTLVGPPANDGEETVAGARGGGVEWGAGEAEAHAEIDFGVRGVVFTLPTSSIRITAIYEGNFAATESPPLVRIGA